MQQLVLTPEGIKRVPLEEVVGAFAQKYSIERSQAEGLLKTFNRIVNLEGLQPGDDLPGVGYIIPKAWALTDPIH